MQKEPSYINGSNRPTVSRTAQAPVMNAPRAAPSREFILLRPDEVLVDPEVQRHFDKPHAKKLASRYRQDLTGLCAVSLRKDGRYYVLNGQHRCAAAIMAGMGDQPIHFEVYRGLSPAEEARLFLDLNDNNKPVGALDKFEKAVKAGDPVHVDIVRILDNFGLRVAASSVDGGVSAVKTLLDIYHSHVGTKPNSDSPIPAGPMAQLLSRTLHVLTSAWGKDRNAFDGLLMKGVAAMLHKHGATIDGHRLARTLSKWSDPSRAIGLIRSLQNAAKKTAATAAVEYLEGLYNRGRREDSRLG